ncbi:hypothetical protein GALL_395940 [mine drainage metagenome]|uniref:Uncharacterized protein n=1 Tax=mine drainage metagenome TaxID=410659 RepID=A0A1J5QFD8_9ZZZZ
MVATETYYYNESLRKNPDSPKVSPHFRDFLYGEKSMGFIIDRPQIEGMINIMKTSLGGS